MESSSWLINEDIAPCHFVPGIIPRIIIKYYLLVREQQHDFVKGY